MTEPPKASPTLSPRAIAAYGAGDLGLNFYWQGAGFFLLFFYTDVLGMPNTMAGLAFAIGGLFDAFSDPAMGFFADRKGAAGDRYRPYLLFGAAPLGVSFFLLFAAPLLAPSALVALAAAVSHIVFRLCYTVVSIPYGALGARLTFDARERTRVAGVRMLFGAAGGVLIVMAATGLRAALPDRTAFLAMSALAGAAGAGVLLLTHRATREQRPIEARSARVHPAPARALKIAPVLLKNAPFLILVASLFLLTVANMITIKMVLYRFSYVLGSPAAGGAAMTLMSAAPLVSIPFWIWAYLKFDKRPAFLLGCAVVASGLAATAMLGDRLVAASVLAHGLIAIGFSSFAVGFWSILPDTIDFGHWKTGERIESGLVGLASASQKIAIALAGLGVGLALDACGYEAGAVQSLQTLRALHNFGAIAPLVLMVAAALAFSRYPISARSHQRIVASLSKQV